MTSLRSEVITFIETWCHIVRKNSARLRAVSLKQVFTVISRYTSIWFTNFSLYEMHKLSPPFFIFRAISVIRASLSRKLIVVPGCFSRLSSVFEFLECDKSHGFPKWSAEKMKHRNFSHSSRSSVRFCRVNRLASATS